MARAIWSGAISFGLVSIPVKLFNAVRASQVKAEQAAQEARDRGIVGVGRREERVTEMSKKGFLDLLTGGGSGSLDGRGSVKVSRLEAA